MHMRCLILSLFFLVSATKLGAQSFDHYVLSLSWSPSWCATEGKERGSEQCSNSADFGWILHGLWPQNDTSWPSYCQSRHAPPSRSLTGSMK
ncbi:MAG: ribonuclease T, partial [Paracoccaceae bacterium]